MNARDEPRPADESPDDDGRDDEGSDIDPAPIAARPEDLRDVLPGAKGGPRVTPGESGAPIPPG